LVDTLGPSYPATQDASFEASVLDQVDAAVIAADRSGLVTRWNRHAEKVFGWTGEEAIGRSILDLVVSPSDLPAINEIMDQVLAGAVWEGEMALLRRDGSRVVCHVNDAPIHDGVGAVVGVVSVSVDVTEAKEAEHRLAARTSVTRALAERCDPRRGWPTALRGIAPLAGHRERGPSGPIHGWLRMRRWSGPSPSLRIPATASVSASRRTLTETWRRQPWIGATAR